MSIAAIVAFSVIGTSIGTTIVLLCWMALRDFE